MKNILIATPMYGGQCTGTYASSMMRVPSVFMQNGLGLYYVHLMNESLITRARNTCVDEFLKTDATHLLFIDADIGFDPAVIPGMIDRDVDIICGLYPKKEINWPRITNAVQRGVPPHELINHAGSVVVNLVEDKPTFVDNGQLIEIKNGGTGFMLIKRKVFEKLAKKVPSYVNDMYRSTDIVTAPQYIKEFFTTSIDKETGRLMSEDYHFCVLARKHGFRVWADPMIDLTHMGTFLFSGATERVLEGQESPVKPVKKRATKKPAKKVVTKRTPTKKPAKKVDTKRTNVKPRKKT